MGTELTTLLIWAIVIGVVAGVVAVLAVIISYKKKLKAPIYPVDKYCTLELIDRRDDYIGSTVTKVRIRSSKRN